MPIAARASSVAMSIHEDNVGIAVRSVTVPSPVASAIVAFAAALRLTVNVFDPVTRLSFRRGTLMVCVVTQHRKN